MPAEHSVRNSLAHGRRAALRAVAWQAAATLLVALPFLVQGFDRALAALVGGGIVTAAGLLAALVALRGEVAPAGIALGRLLAGLVLKWLLVAVALIVALAALQLPGLPLLTGVVVAMLALVLVHSIKQ
jgi:F0F1-type ATP synthase assembly protein I